MNAFKKLHTQANPLIIGNVWDVQSALLFEKNGYQAVGTSSAAVAASMGYEDGEKIPFKELLKIVGNIQDKISIPLTVDIEKGYGSNNTHILNNINELLKLNISGINIEDSISDPKQTLQSSKSFCETINVIKNHITQSKSSLFINVRTDAYIMGIDKSFEETLSRVKQYTNSGADGIFIPCITDEIEIDHLVKSTHLPINVMCMPNLPDFDRLQKIGVKRISMGPFLYNTMIEKIENDIQKITKDNNFSVLF